MLSAAGLVRVKRCMCETSAHIVTRCVIPEREHRQLATDVTIFMPALATSLYNVKLNQQLVDGNENKKLS